MHHYLISVKSNDGANKLVLLEINNSKEYIEVVHWHYVDNRGIEKIKRQAEREDGQLLILPPEGLGEVGALSDPTLSMPSESKDTTSSPNMQEERVKFSLRGLDATYLDAVERGDMETAQRMVDDMAKVFGYTIRGEHGTTHKFTIFNYDYANKENSFGVGHYFTSDYDDAQDNYSSEEGPDLKQRIQLLAERMEYDPEYEDMSDEERLRIATQKLSGGENIIISAALRMDNPVVFGEDADGEIQETYFDFTESYDEETDEYGEPEGTLIDFVNALNDELSSGDYWGTESVDLWDISESDGIYANELRDKVISLLSDTQDNDGNFASHNIFRNALVRMGFDGIIDNEPSIRFSNMGLSRYTKHYIVFDSNQIKLTDPVTYDDNGNIIPLSERFNPEREDIRYSLMQSTDEDVAFDNFFANTSAVFTLLPKSEVPQRDPDYVSKRWDGFGVSSRYWYGEDERGKYVIRASDHWSDYPRGANSRKAFEINPYNRRYTKIASNRWALDMTDAPNVATPRPKPRASQEEWDAYNKAQKAQKAVFEDAYIDGKAMYGKAYLDDFTKWEAEPNFSLRDIANDVREYDATNSTELYDWLNFVESGSIAKNKTQFHIANTGDILNEYGIKGKINVTRKAINAKRHTDNNDHKLGVSGWAFLVATINNPLVITRYNNEPNSYRIYTIAEINGKNICAGVNVNATNGVEITKITTAFGRDITKIEVSSKEKEIYRNENAAEQISGSDNSHLYARLLSTTKVIQNFENPKIEPRFNLRDVPFFDDGGTNEDTAPQRGFITTKEQVCYPAYQATCKALFSYFLLSPFWVATKYIANHIGTNANDDDVKDYFGYHSSMF